MRKYEIDQLRVYAFLILILYHAGLVFVPWEFHMHNNETGELFLMPMFFSHQWRIGLLFVISGIGTYFSMSRRSSIGYAQERFIRLFIPFIFGTLILVLPQVYLRRLTEGVEYSSYLDFYINDAFTKGFYYEGGNFGWHHLWFILYLFIFSMILILLKKPLELLSIYIKKFISSWKGWGITLFICVCIPVFLFEYFLRPIFPETRGLKNDWFIFSEYLWVFLCGYLIARNIDDIWPLLKKSKYFTLIVGIIAYLIYGHYCVMGDEYIMVNAISRTLTLWCIIFSIFGFAIQYLNKNKKWLSYANEAVYPFYILHQTVIIAITFYIRDLDYSIFTKFMIIVFGTGLICWSLYHFVIRKINVLRFLFGMKLIPAKSRITSPTTEL